MTLFHVPGSGMCSRHPLHREPCPMCLTEREKEFTVFRPPNFVFYITQEHLDAMHALVECLTNGNECAWDCRILEINNDGRVTVQFTGAPYPTPRAHEFDINTFSKQVMDLRRSNFKATKLKLSPLLFAQLSNWSQQKGFDSPFGMYSLEGQQVFGLKIHEDLEIDSMGVE